jgi:hypothetical protein
MITDPGSPSQPVPGTMTHALITLGDELTTRVTNFSGRGWVTSGNNNLILGFTLLQAKTVWMKALGPTLSGYNLSPVLSANLTYSVYDSNEKLVAGGGPFIGEPAQSVTLQPGLYTVVLSNPGGSGNPDGLGQLTIQETDPDPH